MFVVDYFVLEIWLRAKDIDGYTIPSFWTFGLLKLLLGFKPGTFNQSKDILKFKITIRGSKLEGRVGMGILSV